MGENILGCPEEDLDDSVTFRDLVKYLEALAKNNDALKARIKAIESRGVIYRGIWQPSQEYSPGDLATYGGSVWHANDVTRATPGDGKTWTLAVKRGENGKDAAR